MSGVSLCAMPAQAQFNTVASVPNRYKVEVLREGTDKAEPTPAGAGPVQGAPVDIPASASPVESRKEIWVGRYLSVSYPLQRIRINSSYGYRKDPFTGKRKFHNGIDLHARGESQRLDGAQHGRAPAYHLQTQRQKYRPAAGTGLHQIHTGGMRGGIGYAVKHGHITTNQVDIIYMER